MARPAAGVGTSLFDDLKAEDVSRFFELAALRSFQDNEVIIAEGDPGDGMFVVASGEVRVEKATIDQKQEVLAILGAGECFGELSLVDRKPRSATVRACGPTDVYVFTRHDLDAFFEAYPAIHRRVLQNLARITSQRLRWSDDALVQSVYDTVILVDRACRVVQWNRLTEAQSPLEGAVAPEHATGKDLFALAPQLGEGVRQKVLQAVDSGEVTGLQLDCEVDPDRVIYFEVTVAPRKEGGRTVGALLAFRNVTEARALEVQLIQAEKLSMAGQMAAEIGHELNNYLAVISGHTDLLLETPELQENERALKSLQAIADQIRKIERFTAGLMDLGMLRSQKEMSDLNLLIERLIQFIQGQSRFRRIEFELALDRNLPHIEIDPGQVQQVLLNLYANAADAMDQGRVTTRTRFDADRKLLVAEVADNGPGMPEEVRERIFDSGFTTKSTGHGFGLAVCARIMENHNGTIEVESEPGQGTTFTLTFQMHGKFQE